MNDVASAVEVQAAKVPVARATGSRDAGHGDGTMKSAPKGDFGRALAEAGTDDGGAAQAVAPGEGLARKAAGAEARVAAGADGGHFLLRQRSFVLPGSLPADSVAAQDGEAPEAAAGEGDAPASDQAQAYVAAVAADAANGAQPEGMSVALTVADLGALIGVGGHAPPAPTASSTEGKSQRQVLAQPTAGDAAASAIALLRGDGAVKPAMGGKTAADATDDDVPEADAGGKMDLRLIGRETHLGGVDARLGAPGGSGSGSLGDGAGRGEKPEGSRPTKSVAEPVAVSEGQRPAQGGGVEAGALQTLDGARPVNGTATAADAGGAATRPGQQVGSEVLRWLSSTREDAALRRATPSQVLQIELVPADLGRVQVRIALKDNQLLVDLSVESGKAAGMIEQDKHKLIGELTSAGYAVDRLTVKNDVVAPTLPSNAGSSSASADGSNGAAQGFGGGAQSEARGRGRNSGARSQAQTSGNDGGRDATAGVSGQSTRAQQLYV